MVRLQSHRDKALTAGEISTENFRKNYDSVATCLLISSYEMAEFSSISSERSFVFKYAQHTRVFVRIFHTVLVCLSCDVTLQKLKAGKRYI